MEVTETPLILTQNALGKETHLFVVLVKKDANFPTLFDPLAGLLVIDPIHIIDNRIMQ